MSSQSWLVSASLVVGVMLSSSSAWAAPNKRLLCGCASSRFLERGPVTVGQASGGQGTLGIWLHGDSTVEGFAVDAGKVTHADAPWRLDLYGVDTEVAGGAISTGGDGRFGQIAATGAGDGWIGIVRRGDKQPRDILQATFNPAVAVAAAPPVVRAMWLAPPEDRERRDCGPWRTQRLAFELTDQSPEIAAFLIGDTLVDARHVGAFGIGRVDVCDHGADVPTFPHTVTVVPISATGARGASWTFAVDEQALPPVKATAVPDTADEDILRLGFPEPGTDRRPMSWRSVGGLWIGIVVVMVVGGLAAFLYTRFKKRRMQSIRCTACGNAVAVDVLDQKFDGFFCPSCGTTGMWKGADGTDFAVRAVDDGMASPESPGESAH